MAMNRPLLNVHVHSPQSFFCSLSPAASAQQRGIRSTIHNDASVTPTRQLHLSHCAVERRTYGGRILGEAQKISRLSALHAMTIDAAWQVFEDSKQGSIENGKLADLVILSENPLETSKSLDDIRVMQTIRRGTIAHQAWGWFTRRAHFAGRLCSIIIFLDQAGDQVRFTSFLRSSISARLRIIATIWNFRADGC